MPKNQHPIKTLKKINADAETGEIELNYYGEPIERVKGLFCDDLEVRTRLKEWTIRDIETGEETNETFDYSFLKTEGESFDPWIIRDNRR